MSIYIYRFLCQVGRLSRQAGEEGSERRRAEERITELEAHVDEDNKEKERLLLRLERVCAERDNLAQELKNIAQDVVSPSINAS